MPATLSERLKGIKAVISDVDGCLTDGLLLYSGDSLEIKTFNTQDGLGIKLASESGLITGLITGRTSPAVERRAVELGIDDCFQGVSNKVEAWESIKRKRKLADIQMAYLGDDLPDLCLLSRAGCSFAPSDAVADVRAVVDVVLQHRGGAGALREVIEYILKAQGLWDDIVRGFSRR